MWAEEIVKLCLGVQDIERFAVGRFRHRNPALADKAHQQFPREPISLGLTFRRFNAETFRNLEIAQAFRMISQQRKYSLLNERAARLGPIERLHEMSLDDGFHEYAFDIKMYAVVRVCAKNRKTAERVLQEALDCANLDVDLDHRDGDVKVTEASVHIDDVEFPLLFEYDGIDVELDNPEIV